MKWYLWYLITGLYVTVMFYGTSVIYKVKHKDYKRQNPLASWKWLYTVPLAVVLFPIIILAQANAVMCYYHERQKRYDKEFEEFFKEVNEL
jgi:hypothetical protein